MSTPIQVLNLLTHVREIFPDITILVIDVHQRWLLMNDDFDAPSFEGKKLNFDLFDEAVNSVSLPYICQLIEED